jgi:hypothetical protein
MAGAAERFMAVRRALALVMLLVGCAHQLADSGPQRLREWRVGRAIHRSLDGADLTEADEARALASLPRAAQTEARSRRLYAGSLAVILGGFAIGLSAVPRALELHGDAQAGTATMMLAAPAGMILGFALHSYAGGVHREAIVWFNRAARDEQRAPVPGS